MDRVLPVVVAMCFRSSKFFVLCINYGAGYMIWVVLYKEEYAGVVRLVIMWARRFWA